MQTFKELITTLILVLNTENHPNVQILVKYVMVQLPNNILSYIKNDVIEE